ncbi:MAG TPA: hypothetical protein VH988_30070 [Thermoanaerobaculia bacterium]|jgi:hypothetical protein|nr:hypothetical protein [Thermoanaerobaculia bacterium]
MKKHPVSDRSLQHFLSGASSRAERQSIVAHLLHGCTACAAAVSTTLHPEVPDGAYDAIFDRLAEELSPASPGTLLAFAKHLPVPAPSGPLAAGRVAAHSRR